MLSKLAIVVGGVGNFRSWW